MTNPITADAWEGIRARHSLVESAGQPTDAARAMAYLSHLDRRDLIAEIERLRRLLSESVEVLRDLGDHANADEFEKQAGGPSDEPGAAQDAPPMSEDEIVAASWWCMLCDTLNSPNTTLCTKCRAAPNGLRPEKSEGVAMSTKALRAIVDSTPVSDRPVCSVCKTPLRRAETNYGPGWQLACDCTDGLPSRTGTSNHDG